MSKIFLGVDFDNTIVSYDELMYERSVSQGWIAAGFKKSKKDIRDFIRGLPDGEIKWQHLQRFAYVEGIKKAGLIAGVKEVFLWCRKYGIKTAIVSHKTEYASLDSAKKSNLREAAMGWMMKQDFFKEEDLGLSVKDIFFEHTREAKIERIKRLRCTHFIDDLEETFLAPTFPLNVARLLYQKNEGRRTRDEGRGMKDDRSPALAGSLGRWTKNRPSSLVLRPSFFIPRPSSTILLFNSWKAIHDYLKSLGK